MNRKKYTHTYVSINILFVGNTCYARLDIVRDFEHEFDSNGQFNICILLYRRDITIMCRFKIIVRITLNRSIFFNTYAPSQRTT